MAQKEDIPVDNMHLLFAGKILLSDQTALDYGIKGECTLRVVLKY